jgi:hypothetical protein
MTKRLGITLVSAIGLVLPALPVAAADGWAVRICRGFTEASAIKIEVGEAGGKDQLLVNWKSDNTATDFPLPAALKDAKKIEVEADSEPADGSVSMCVLFNGTAAKGMNFNDELEVTVAQGDKDPSCKCPNSGGQ